jgi:subtilisin family serine protease
MTARSKEKRRKTVVKRTFIYIILAILLLAVTGLLAGSANASLPVASGSHNGSSAVLASQSKGKPTTVSKTAPSQGTAQKISGGLLAQFGTRTQGDKLQYWIILQDQADTSNKIPNSRWAEKGWYVYNALTAKANATQKPLFAQLATLQQQGQVSTVKSFWIINSIMVIGDLNSAQAMAADPAVRIVREPGQYHLLDSPQGSVPSLSSQAEAILHGALAGTKSQPGFTNPLTIQHNISEVHAPEAWALGYDGTGVTVENMDTGVRWTHEALYSHYRGVVAPPDPSNIHDYNWFDGFNGLAEPGDDGGHGTHTMGTIVGSQESGGTFGNIGVAKGAQWISVRICNHIYCDFQAILSGFQWTLAPTRVDGTEPRPDLRPRISSNSWGTSDCSGPVFQTAVTNWVNAGIFPDFANGNNGPGAGTVSALAAYADSWGTGALDTSGSNWAIADFSSRGPSCWDGSIRPQAIAPGVQICSAYNTSDTTYNCSLSGTSMSTPHIAGAVVILLQKNPDLAVAQYMYALTSTAFFSPTWGVQPNNDYGWGLIQIDAALNSIPSGGTPVPTRTATNTVTGTPPTATNTRTSTPTHTPTPCQSALDYDHFETTGATIVPGTDDMGLYADDDAVLVNLPFSFTFYGSTFSTVSVTSNGQLDFVAVDPYGDINCMPDYYATYAILAHWDDLRTDGQSGCSAYPTGCGVFTSVTGTAPNRIFNIEWRAVYASYFGSHPANFEARLYEGQTSFDVIYGDLGGLDGTDAIVGVQKDESRFTEVECNNGGLSPGVKITFFQPPCATGTPPTPTNTRTRTTTPTRTSTKTPTPTDTGTPPTSTPTPCGPNGNYIYSVSTGATIVPGTTDTGNHCDDCDTVVTLPFSYTLYDQTFSSVAVGSNGHLTFGTNYIYYDTTCMPIAGVTYAIGPYWADQCTGPCDPSTCTGCGIFTSVSGTAPNRIFNIEYRTNYYGTNIALDYEVRLFEGQNHFSVIYRSIVPKDSDNDSALAVGVQKNATQYTQAACDSTGGHNPPVSNGQIYDWTLPACATATRTATRTPTRPTNTPTRTPTPCGVSNLDVTDVTITCNPDGTVHWTATVANGSTCTVTGAHWGAALEIRNGGGNFTPVRAQTGVVPFPPGNTAVSGDFCYAFRPNTTGMRVAFGIAQPNSTCLPNRTSPVRTPCTVTTSCP